MNKDIKAFPLNSNHFFPEHGMDLRDYFAAKAMQAIITKMPIVDQEGEFGKPISDKAKYNRDVCESAYIFADAMLEARNK